VDPQKVVAFASIILEKPEKFIPMPALWECRHTKTSGAAAVLYLPVAQPQDPDFMKFKSGRMVAQYQARSINQRRK